MATASEININQSASAVDMAQAIFGDGVTVTGASYSGSSYSSGIYSGGDTITPGVTPGDTGVILSTGSVDYFTRPSGDPNKSNSISTNSGGQFAQNMMPITSWIRCQVITHNSAIDFDWSGLNQLHAHLYFTFLDKWSLKAK